MYIVINPAQMNHYVAYSLTDQNGLVFHIGVAPQSQLTSLSDVPGEIERPDIELYLSILDRDVDRVKLINRTLAWCHNNGHAHLTERLNKQYVSWSRDKKARSVRCIDTGEEFKSATEAARQHNLTYGALLKHLAREKSYNSVKGKRYEYI